MRPLKDIVERKQAAILIWDEADGLSRESKADALERKLPLPFSK